MYWACRGYYFDIVRSKAKGTGSLYRDVSGFYVYHPLVQDLYQSMGRHIGGLDFKIHWWIGVGLERSTYVRFLQAMPLGGHIACFTGYRLSATTNGD